MTGKIDVRIVTGVWGDWHISAMLDVNLPSLLAPGNFDAFCRVFNPTFQLYTLPEDVDRISNAPILDQLRERCTVQITQMPQDLLHDPIGAHKQPWILGLDQAHRENAFVMFYHPDIAWADGSFGHLAKLALQGRKAVFMTFMRVVSDTFVPEFRANAAPGISPISIPPRKLVDMSFRHMHPLMAAYFHDSPFFPHHAEMIFWPVYKEGVHVRLLAREMFLFDPRQIAMTNQLLLADGFNPADIEIISDSDDLFAVSLAEIGKDSPWYDKPDKVNPIDIGQWLLTFESSANDLVGSVPIRWHVTDCTESLWRRREHASSLLLSKSKATREAIRIWRSLVYLNLTFTSASILSFALQTGVIPKAFPTSQNAAILVLAPSDSALNGLGDNIDGLFSPNRQDDLIAFLRHHIIVLDSSISEFEERLSASDTPKKLSSLAGRTLEFRRRGDHVTVDGVSMWLHQAHRTHQYLVCAIDGALDPKFDV